MLHVLPTKIKKAYKLTATTDPSKLICKINSEAKLIRAHTNQIESSGNKKTINKRRNCLDGIEKMWQNNHQHHHHHCPSYSRQLLPNRIILVRHGESAGNLDTCAYATTPDHKIPLTPDGIDQARSCGARLRSLLSGSANNYRVYFYVSPYDRTRSTLREIGRSFSRKRIIGVREECRIREQDFGNFQVLH